MTNYHAYFLIGTLLAAGLVWDYFRQAPAAAPAASACTCKTDGCGCPDYRTEIEAIKKELAALKVPPKAVAPVEKVVLDVNEQPSTIVCDASGCRLVPVTQKARAPAVVRPQLKAAPVCSSSNCGPQRQGFRPIRRLFGR